MTGKEIYKNLVDKGYIEFENKLYPPYQVELLLQSGIDIRPKKKDRLKTNKKRLVKTGWIDDTLNIKNKSTKFDPFIALVKMDLNLEVWTEFIFSVEKNYKFDYAIPVDNSGRIMKIAIEVDGGTWSNKRSGHSSGTGLERDRQKSSLASSEGWRLIRVTPSQLCTSHTLNLISKTIHRIAP